MARKRMLSPEIWADPSFNKLSRDARLLFIGMMSHSDDEGYIRADAGSIKRLVLGFDDVSIAEIKVWLGELATVMQNLHFFYVGNETYAHFVKWSVHQKQQKDRIQASTYPKCSTCLAPATQVLKEVSKEVSKKQPESDKDLFAELTKASNLPINRKRGTYGN